MPMDMCSNYSHAISAVMEIDKQRVSRAAHRKKKKQRKRFLQVASLLKSENSRQLRLLASALALLR